MSCGVHFPTKFFFFFFCKSHTLDKFIVSAENKQKTWKTINRLFSCRLSPHPTAQNPSGPLTFATCKGCFSSLPPCSLNPQGAPPVMEMQMKSPVPIFSFQLGSIKRLRKPGEAAVQERMCLKLGWCGGCKGAPLLRAAGKVRGGRASPPPSQHLYRPLLRHTLCSAHFSSGRTETQSKRKKKIPVWDRMEPM